MPREVNTSKEIARYPVQEPPSRASVAARIGFSIHKKSRAANAEMRFIEA